MLGRSLRSGAPRAQALPVLGFPPRSGKPRTRGLPRERGERLKLRLPAGMLLLRALQQLRLG